jgi:hypothetical protein
MDIFFSLFLVVFLEPLYLFYLLKLEKATTLNYKLIARLHKKRSSNRTPFFDYFANTIFLVVLELPFSIVII